MTQNLIIKEIAFEGITLKAIQDPNTQKIYVGAKWICNGLNLSKSQKDTQIQKIQTDLVIKSGCLKFQAGVFDPNNETIALDIDFLPLWLAKISITPKMQKNQPEITERLIQYQLKAKDVLAKAFLYGEFDLPTDYKSALSQLVLMCDKNNELQNANIQLKNQNKQLEPKAEMCDKFLLSKGYISLNKTAKGLKLGRNKMMAFLRSKSVLFIEDDDNIPYQQFINSGYFIIDYHNGRDGKLHAVTKVSAKGIKFIHKLYLKYAPYIMEVA